MGALTLGALYGQKRCIFSCDQCRENGQSDFISPNLVNSRCPDLFGDAALAFSPRTDSTLRPPVALIKDSNSIPQNDVPPPPPPFKESNLESRFS